MSAGLLTAALLMMLVAAVFSVRWLAGRDEHGWLGRFGTPLLFGAWDWCSGRC